MRQLIIPIFLPEAGCPGRCVFCDQRPISGVNQIIEPAKVPNLITDYLATNPCPQTEVEVAFFGGTFTALPDRLQQEYLQAVDGLRQQGRVHKLRVSTRPDRINAENIRLLSDYGVWLVELGIQSADNNVLYLTGRGYVVQQIKDAINIIQQAGLQFGAQLMPGLPGASYQSDVDSAAACAGWGSATARIYPTLVLAGTQLEAMYRRGEYQPLSLENAVEVSAQMYQQFAEHSIPVIRMGLQATKDLDRPGEVVAGPWHPAFGELVKSRLWRRQLDEKMSEYQGESKVEIVVPYRYLSQARGQHSCNQHWLEQKYQAQVHIVGSDMLLHEKIICKKMRDHDEIR